LKSIDVEVERHERFALVRPVGDLDLAAKEEVEAALEPLEKEFREVILDLRSVEFLDSTGLRVLLSANARSRADGFRLRIVGGGEAVQRVIALTGMDKHLPLIEPNDVPEPD